MDFYTKIELVERDHVVIGLMPPGEVEGAGKRPQTSRSSSGHTTDDGHDEYHRTSICPTLSPPHTRSSQAKLAPPRLLLRNELLASSAVYILSPVLRN
jgi:hypothetical protein